MHGLEDLLNDAQRVEKDAAVNREKNNLAKEDNLKAVRDFRKDIDDYFDKLQIKVEQEIRQCHSRNEGMLTEQLKTCLEVKEKALIKQKQINSIVQKNLKCTLYARPENLRTEIATLKQTLNEASRQARCGMYEFQKNDVVQSLILTESVLGTLKDNRSGIEELTYTLPEHVERNEKLMQTQGLPSQPNRLKNKSGSLPCEMTKPITTTEVQLHKAKKPWKQRRLNSGTSRKEVEENDVVSQGLPCQPNMQKNKPGLFPCEMNQSIRTTEVQLHKAKKPWKQRRQKSGTNTKKEEQNDGSRGKSIQPGHTNKSEPPPCQTNQSIRTTEVELHKAKKPWKPRRLETADSEKEVEENDDAIEDLCKKTQIILNKLTPQNFQVLVSQMQALKIDTEDKLNGIVDLVFEKTISEPDYSEVYANMCKCLSKLKVKSDSKPGKELDTDKDKPRMDQYFEQMTKIANDKKSSTRVRFMLQDIISVRLNKWVPRCSDNNPKTIDQIHMEVAQERQVKARLSQEVKELQKLHKGDRRDPTSGQIDGGCAGRGADGWSMEGKQPQLALVDRSKDQTQISKQNVDEEIKLGSDKTSMDRKTSSAPANRSEEDISRIIPDTCPGSRERRCRGGFWTPLNLRTRIPQEHIKEGLVNTKRGGSTLTTPSTGLPMTEIADRLHDLVVVRREDNETLFNWIESNIDDGAKANTQFIRELMTAVCQSSIKGEKGKEEVVPSDISKRRNLLQKYLGHKPMFELQALFALQVLVARLEYPQGLLKSLFHILYDEDIISEDAFVEWKRSEDEPDGKNTTLEHVVKFFEWLT
ncbi:IF4G3-like protein [Mya arenaria]|uniref:IF4G3-like protein n=1 Tax=Mya arenaria TaxID=6604 RepID=A0ABY7EZY4_MYAAR|nr:IF4G3-like protein [Mya arenaria]